MNTRIDHMLYDALDEERPEWTDETDLLLQGHRSEAVFRAGRRGIVMGTEVLVRLFDIVDDTVLVKVINPDGARVEEGDVIAIVHGATASIQKTVPTARTFLSRLSAISTSVTPLAKRLHDAAIETICPAICTPLFRAIEEWAFQESGGVLFEHWRSPRRHLTPMHYQATGSIHNAVHQLRDQLAHGTHLVCEVETFEQYTLANHAFCDIIVLYASSVQQASAMFTDDPPNTPVLLDLRETPFDQEAVCRLPIAALRPTIEWNRTPVPILVEHHEIGR